MTVRPGSGWTRPAAGLAALALLLAGAGCDSPTGPAGPPSGSPSPTGAVLPADFTLAAGGATTLRSLGLPGTRMFPGKGTDLRGPHFRHTFEGAVTTRSLTAKQASAFGLDGATGVAPEHELVIAQAGFDSPIGGATYPEDGNVDAIEVSVGGQTRRVAMDTPQDFRGLLAVSVPAGTHPVLRITDAGRRQSLDLVTGRRGSDAIAGYYPYRSDDADTGTDGTWLLLSGAGAAGLVREARLAAVTVQDVDYQLDPYIPDRRWARPGRRWLVVDVRMTYWRPSAGTEDTDEVRVPAGNFTLTGSDGSRLRLSRTAISLGRSSAPTSSPVTQEGFGRMIAEVPAALRAATLVFRFDGSIRTPRGSVSWSVYSGPASVPMGLRLR